MVTDKTQDKALSIKRSDENHQEKQDKKSHIILKKKLKITRRWNKTNPRFSEDPISSMNFSNKTMA